MPTQSSLLLPHTPKSPQETTRNARCSHDPGDDGKGSEGMTVAHFDDCTPFLHPQDVVPCSEAIQTTHGAPLGLHLNFVKTKLLTTTTGTSVRDPTVPQTKDKLALMAALDCTHDHAPLDQQSTPSTEITTGTRLLGQPTGSVSFAREFLTAATTTHATNLATLRAAGLDTHTKASLFRSCSQPSLTHLFDSDFCYNAPLTVPADFSLFNWQSDLTKRISAANKDFVAFLADVNEADLTPLSHLVTFHPASFGGFGLQAPAATAMPLALMSLTRTIQCATKGIIIGEDLRLPLKHQCASVFQAWQSSSKRSFTLFRTHAPSLRQAHNKVQHRTHTRLHSLTDFVDQANLQGLSPKLHAHCTKHSLALFLESAMPQESMCFPSTLSTLTSSPLTPHHRGRPCNRLKDCMFVPLLQRKLCLQLLPSELIDTPRPFCLHKLHPLDPCGDHFFTCGGIVKTTLHNAIGDALHFVCQNLAPMAGMAHSKHNISHESHVLGTTKRPADVGIQHRPSAMHQSHSHPTSLLALDVTVASSPSPLPIVIRPNPNATPLSVVHHNAQRKKLCCSQYTKQATGYSCKQWVQWHLDQHILRLPFTVDPFLGLGTFAHWFLHGTAKSTPPLQPKLLPRPHPVAATALELAVAAPRALLPKADSAALDSLFKPSTWAQRTLALNASVGLAKHIQYSLALLNGTDQCSPSQVPILGSPFSTLQPPQLT